MQDIGANNRRIAKNTAFLYVRMIFVMVLTLYASRVILNALGVVDYGVYSVIAGFVSLFGFLNATLSSSMQRYYNYEGTKSVETGYQRVYVTGLLIHAIASAALLVVLESFGLWYVNHVMVVPADKMHAANILFQSSVISILLVTLQVPYAGAIMAKEKMDYYAIVSIVDAVLKLVAVVMLKYVSGDRLVAYALFLLVTSVIVFLMYFIYAKISFCELRITGAYDKKLFSEILSFSGWNLLGTFAFMLKGQGVNMVLNYFCGPVVNAARGLAFQVNSAVNSFSSSIAVAFRPQLVNSYADGDTTRTRAMMFIESKVCFFLVAFLAIPVSLEIDTLLTLWLGKTVPEGTALFSVLVLADALVCSLNIPCTQVIWAVGDIKKYQLYSSVVNLLLVPSAFALMKLGLKAESAFVITILFSIINQSVCLTVTARMFPLGLKSYVKRIVIPCLLSLALMPLLPVLFHCLVSDSLLRLVVVSMLSALSSIAVGYFVLLEKTEREYVVSMIQKIFHRV